MRSSSFKRLSMCLPGTVLALASAVGFVSRAYADPTVIQSIPGGECHAFAPGDEQFLAHEAYGVVNRSPADLRVTCGLAHRRRPGVTTADFTDVGWIVHGNMPPGLTTVPTCTVSSYGSDGLFLASVSAVGVPNSHHSYDVLNLVVHWPQVDNGAQNHLVCILPSQATLRSVEEIQF